MNWNFAIDGKLVRFPVTDGILLHGFLIPVKGSNKVVMHVPGMSSNFYDDFRFPHLANKITKAGFSFLSVNNRGHEIITGISTIKGKWVTGGTALERFEGCLKDIKAAIDFASKKGFSKIILLGHSTGCQKVTYYQSKTQDRRVNGIILLAPTDDYNSYKKELGKDYKKVLETAKNLKHENTLLPPKLMKGHFFSGKRFLSDADIRNVEARIFNYDSKMELFSKIKCPILAVFGSKEQHRVKPVEEHFEILRKNTGSSKFDSLIIKNANHSFIGKEKELAKKVANWVRNLNL